MKTLKLFFAGLIFILTPTILSSQSVHFASDTVHKYLFSSPVDSAWKSIVVNSYLDSAEYHILGYEMWNPSSGLLEISSRYIDILGGDSLKKYYIIENYDVDTHTWHPSTKWEYFRDAYGNDTLTYAFRFSKETESWSFYHEGKEKYTYDENGQIIEHLFYSGNPGEVKLNRKEMVSYDERGNTLEILAMDWTGSGWMNTIKSVYTWDESDRRTALTQHRWDTDLQDWWVGAYSQTSYSPDGLSSLSDSYTRSKQTDEFGIRRAYSYFDQHGDLLRSEIYYWDEVAEIFDLTQKKISYYGPEEIIKYAMVCKGDSLLWQGQYYDEEMCLMEKFNSSFGRDSIQRLELTISLPPEEFEIFGPIEAHQHLQTLYCTPLDSQLNYSWLIDNGIISSEAINDSVWVEWLEVGEGRISAYADNSYGCRSDTINLEIGILELLEYRYYESDTICEGDSLQWRGAYYMQEGSYQIGYLTSVGGDSIYNLNLAVNQKPAALTIFGQDEVYNGQLSTYSATEDSKFGYEWNAQNCTILSTTMMDSLSVKWGHEGMGWISVFAVNEEGCRSDTTFLEVLIGPNGIQDLMHYDDRIYPNPAIDYIVIQLADVRSIPSRLFIYDNLGRLTYSTEEIFNSQFEIDVSHYESGLYFYKLLNEDDKIESIGRFFVK